MKIAIISDIHGNYPALRDVLEDARSRGVDEYIFAGDYCLSGAWPDECIKTLMEIPNKVIIRGNEERYLENLIGKDQSKWTDGQMQVSYWCYRNITPERLEYVLSLPRETELIRNGVKIRVAHACDAFLDGDGLLRIGSTSLSERGIDTKTPELLRQTVNEILMEDPGFGEKMNKLEDGVYVFGHSHVQWSYEAKGGRVLFVNPGSCGLPLDRIRDTIPYTILTITDGGEVSSEEIRLPFAMERYVGELKKTTQYTEANVWTKLIFSELTTAREHLMFFLQFADKFANDRGDTRRPFAVETWEAAYDAWEHGGCGILR